MANLSSTSDILKRCLEDAGETNDGNSRYHELALECLNEAYLCLLSGASEFNLDVGDAWSWARSTTPRSITLKPAYETGTVALTNGSTSGTFGTTPSASLGSFKYRWLKLDDQPSYYLITAHTAGSASFTLDSAVLEASASYNFKAIQTRYDLGSKILRLAEPMRVYSDLSVNRIAAGADDRGKIYGIGLGEFRKKYPLHQLIRGTPDRYATYRRNDDEWWIEVNGYPAENVKVDFDWIEIPAGLTDDDTEIPLCPREFRKALRYMTSHFLCVKKENDKLTQYFFAMAERSLKALQKAENRNITVASRNKGVMLARQEELTDKPLEGYY